MGMRLLDLLRKLIKVLFGGTSDSQKKGAKPPKEYHYMHKDFLVTRAEAEFFRVLLRAVPTGYAIYPQVHLSAIVEHKVKGQNWKAAFSHINGKSVDFVICDKVNFRPLVAIELDDRTHEQRSRQVRDREVERVLKEAKLPLVRFSGQQSAESVLQRLSADTELDFSYAINEESTTQ